jgi:hypothetical protein
MTRAIRAIRGSARRLLRTTVAAAVCAAFVLGASGCGELAIGALLAQLTNDVNNVVANAGAQAQATTYGAAAALQAAISQEESAFATDLNKGIDHVDSVVANNINRLKALVTDFQSHNQQLVSKSLTEAQLLLNTIPFSNKNPQVSSYSPIFTTARPGTTVEVHVHGNFVYAFQKNLLPTLKIGGAVYQPNLNTTADLGFAVPAAVFSAPTDRLGHLELELVAPYEKGVVFRSVHPGIFRLLVATLPPSPVKAATITDTVPVGGTIQQGRTSPPSPGQYELNSYDCNDHTEHGYAEADQGWSIVPTSWHAIYTELVNADHTHLSVKATTAAINIVYSTQSDCFLGIGHGSGEVHFYIDYQEQQPNSATQQKTISLNIGWGDVAVVPVTKNKWHLDATLFDGTQLAATDTDHSSPYLKIDNEGENVRIAAPATESLVEGAAAQQAISALSHVIGATKIAVGPHTLSVPNVAHP